ncbi:MAG: leucine-rich repeat protein [Oscillospiraceae bacterium]|nr:leucine-rich repeat protein [Oscillospiraceae bacterium]
MKHRWTAALTALTMLGSTVPMAALPETALIAQAEEETPISGTYGENLTWTLDDAGTLTISGTGKMYDSNMIYKDDWESVQTVIIEDGVTSIGGYAFERCTNLTEITIPDSVTSIGAMAFRYCSSLTKMTIPDSVTSIGEDAFQYCASLTDITIPDSVTSIGCNPFRSTPWLEARQKEDPLVVVNGFLIDGQTCSGAVTIPDSVKSIGQGAFQYCTGLTEITIPDSVTSIGVSAFYNCTSLTDITIPDSLTNIGSFAFKGTPWLKAKQAENPLVVVNGILIDGQTCSGAVTIPDSVTSIGDAAFNNCEGLTGISIPDSVTSIGYNAFNECTGLTEVTIPDSVTSLGRNAFFDCTSLTEMTIPDSVTIIGQFAFHHCYKLTIKGYAGSYAETYAQEYSIPFESLGASPEHPATPLLGDLDNDTTVNASDAAKVLIAAAAMGAGEASGLTEAQIKAADVNSDGTVNASDAAIILIYSAAVGAGQEDAKITDFVH